MMAQSSGNYAEVAAKRSSVHSPGRTFRGVQYLIVLTFIVHVLTGMTIFQQTAAAADPIKLPPHVTDLKDAILSATRTGNIEDLSLAFEVSGSAPDFGIGGQNDPITAIKAASADGDGREFLAAMADALSMAPAALPLGKDLENNLIYVWPYLAERQPRSLSPGETVDLLRLVSADKAQEMRANNRWLWWRLAIGADGAWLSFKKAD